MKNMEIKPFIKWAGGKSQLISEIRKQYPAGLGLSIKRYAEPFVGGGAVLFDVLNSFNFDAVYISDTNAALINTYLVVRDNVDALIELLTDYEEKYVPADSDKRKALYYCQRERFNELNRSGNYGIEAAALFIFLNKTCFNGLYRVNSKGEFNVPIGGYKKPLICDADNLQHISKALENVEIVCGDYHASDAFIDENTFVYFDPPYRPLTVTSSFTAYTENAFDDNDQAELAEYIQRLSERGAHIVASNSDPKNTNPDDTFFDDLYSRMNIMRISASRMINSKGNCRGKISELLICSN